MSTIRKITVGQGTLTPTFDMHADLYFMQIIVGVRALRPTEGYISCR